MKADHCPECGTHLRLAVIADRPRIASFVAGLIGLAGAVGVPFCWIIVVALMGFLPETKGEWVGAAGFVFGLIISAAFLAAWVMFYPRYRRLRPLVRWLLAVACFVWAVGSLVTPVLISVIIDA